MHIPKWLVATAGLLVVVLIAAIAFFIGRGTSPPPPEAPIADSPPVAEASAGALTSPLTASTSTRETAATEPPASTATAALSSSSPPTTAADTSQATADARARVSAYFKQMDAIQSGAPIGDQETFANTVLQGATSGDFSAIDDLVRAACDAERRAAALQPPGECAEYHRQAVTLLQETSTMVTALRDGLKRSDSNALTSVGASAQSMKSRAQTLAAAEKALRARYALGSQQ